MPSYTTSLRLIQPSTGEYPGDWGNQVNSSLTAVVDKAVAGTASITMTAANYTLTNANGVADEAKSMFLVLQGTPGASYFVIVPTVSKLYFVTNNTGFDQSVSTSASGGVSVPNGASMVLRCDGTNVVAALDYSGIATNFTATQTFSGSASALAMVLTDAAEVCTVSATAATGTINYDVTAQSVLYYTTNASANWTVNFRASSGTSLNAAMATGQSVTVAFLVTQGTTAYYNSAVQVDGTTSGVTTRWQGGVAPTVGNASSVDIYTYTIIKTGAATFSVFASQTNFA